MFGLRFTRPAKRLRQQAQYKFHLVLRFELIVAAGVFVVGFVPDVPREDALIARERTDNALHIRFETRILLRVL